MEITTISLEELVKPEKNVRIHTKHQLKEFERSIKMFGQIRPVVIDENNVILAGSGLYDTLVMMGKKTAYVYRYENLTENQKKKLMIADNKIFSLGVEDLDTLNSFFEELSGDLDIPGFDEEVLKQMVSETEDVTERVSGYGLLDEESIQHIKGNAARKEQKIQDILTGKEEKMQRVQQDSTMAGDMATSPVLGSVETDAARKSVICPKCGEEIWL